MPPKKKQTALPNTYIKPQQFDGYDKSLPIQQALGTGRVKSVFEAGTTQSANYKSRTSGWRITPLAVEFNDFVFADGSITFQEIQDIATNRILGRSTAGSGVIEQITIGSGLSLSAGALSSLITQYTDEMAQDAVGTILNDSDTVDFTYNDGAPSITADVRKQMSIISDGAGLKLSGDAATPGNSKYYGTDSSGTKGYNNLPFLPLFDHFADGASSHTDGTEDDLYSDTLAAGRLATNGEKISAEYGGLFVNSATATRRIQIRFAGTSIFDTGALTLSLSAAWTAYVSLIRVSSTVIRYMISLTTEGAALAAYTSSGELAGLTLSGTNILKITGIAAGVGAASADIVAKMGSIEWIAAA